MSDNRTYLAVPFSEKDAAKALGARFDRDAKAWFVPPGVDAAPFAAWQPNRTAGETDPQAALAAKLREASFILGPHDPVLDGRIHHVRVDGNTGTEMSGSYRAYGDGVPNGWFQNFRIHPEPQKWHHRTQALTPANRQAMLAASAQKRLEAAAAQRQGYDEAATRLQGIWDAGIENAPHPYLAAKGLKPDGLRIAAPDARVTIERKRDGELIDVGIAGRLLVPLRNLDGQLRTLQIIDDQGQKMFARGGEVVRSHHVIGDTSSPWPLHFTEGYATGRAIHDATSHGVVVAFSANNLAPVAAAYRERYPDRTFLIGADNDHRKARERDAEGRLKPNTGKERGEAAARLVNGYVMLPPFAQGDAGKDWDDYKRQHGMNGLRQELARQMAVANRKKIVQEIERDRNYGRSTPTRAMALSR